MSLFRSVDSILQDYIWNVMLNHSRVKKYTADRISIVIGALENLNIMNQDSLEVTNIKSYLCVFKMFLPFLK